MSGDELPPGWAHSSLGDVAKWSSGGTPKAGTKEYYGGPTPWAVIGDLNDSTVSSTAASITAEGLANSSAKVVPAGALLLAMYGSIGKLGIAGVDMATNQAIAAARVEPGISTKYLFWWLYSQRSELLAAGQGGTQANISQTILRAWPVPVAPSIEQRRIVAEIERRLSHVEAAERSLAAASSRLRTAKLSLLRAAAAGDLTGSAGESMVDVCARAGIPHKAIPGRPGWAAVSLGTIATVGSGSTPKRGESKYWSGGTIPWVTSGQIVGGRITKPAELITETALAETSVRKWPAGTLLMAMYGEGRTRGHCAELLIEATCNQACAAIALNSTFEQAKGFLKLVLQARYEENRVLGSGGVQENLNLGLVKSIVVEMPPFEQQGLIVDEVERRMSLLDSAGATIQAQQRRCWALRRSILAAAFRGELVAQDPEDEPAETLLQRIRDERAATGQSKTARKRPASGARKTKAKKEPAV